MSLTNKALFVVERNLHSNLRLDEIAASCGVSRFHLSHAFGEATGMSVVEYVRGRRLSEAAQQIAAGARDILAIALDCGYQSHEAFSRAFKSRFGETPASVRKSMTVKGLNLMGPLRHLEGKAMQLKEPDIKRERELLFIGVSDYVSFNDMQNIAGLWEHFMSGPYHAISDKRGEAPVGIAIRTDVEGIEYMCAAGVTKFGDVPKDCTKLTVAPATYMVFAHDAHVSRIRETYEAIWNLWFPESDKTPSGAPSFERHNDTFDPRTGNGGVTIWIPVSS